MERFEDITAEMRAFKNHPNAKKSVSGSFLTGLLYGLANRLDAARKRECEPVGIADSLGNAAAMREALVIAMKAICHHARANHTCASLAWENSTINANCGDILCAYRDLCEAKTAIQKALSSPPRNCDRFEDAEIARHAWLDDSENWDELGSPELELYKWLFAPAKEEKGEDVWVK